MTQPNYTDAMMEAVCEALAEFEPSVWAVSNLAHDLPNAFAEMEMGDPFGMNRPISPATEAERKPVAAE